MRSARRFGRKYVGHAGGLVKTILVADDDKPCRESIQKVLERKGYGVETAADVDSALEALRKRRFDLVVCDYRMPVKTGLDFLIELRQRQLQVPVVMLSADAANEASALSLGASQFLVKPIRMHALVDSARKVIRGHS
jgi:DNA-binding response OmpR family regulator